jgi:DNA repair exonuclease SbcCD ATPase subunit
MTSSKITISRLRVEAFRGFRDAREFDLSASAIVVTGSNGTGKTSFFDALQWGFLGTIDRLEALRSRRNVEHVVNQYRLGHKASVEIDLRLPSGSVTLRRTGDHGGSTLELGRTGEPSLFGDEAETELRALLLPDSELSLQSALTTSGLMQQDDLRGVLEARPAERFQQLSTVLGLGALEDFEDAVKSASKQANERQRLARDERDRLAAALRLAQDQLEVAQARLATRPQVEAVRDEALSRLRAVPPGVHLSAIPLALESINDVRLVASAFGRAADLVDSSFALVRHAAELREALEDDPPAADRLSVLSAEVERAVRAKESAEALRGAAQSQLNSARLGAADVARLAALAVPMLSDDCPVCGQQIDRDHVERDLMERAEATGTLLNLQNTFVKRSNDFVAAAAAVTTARDAFAAAEQNARRWHESRSADDAAAASVRALAEEIELLRFEQYVVEPFAFVAQSVSDYLRSVRHVLYELLETFDRQSDQGAIERAAAEANNLDAALATAEGLMAAESARSQSLSALAQKTIEARVDVTEERLRSVQPLVADIFRRLDPHPAFKTVEFELDTFYRKGTTSPLVTDQLTGISAEPLLIFSTSQANIVALSYFIAMSLSMEDAGLPFLLLDDPVQSMDDVNVLGFADLCRHLRVRRQLIVSTHERRLSGLLERKLAPRSEQSQTKVIKFTGWDRSGPTVEERFVEGLMLDGPIRVLRPAI